MALPPRNINANFQVINLPRICHEFVMGGLALRSFSEGGLLTDADGKDDRFEAFE